MLSRFANKSKEPKLFLALGVLGLFFFLLREYDVEANAARVLIPIGGGPAIKAATEVKDFRLLGVDGKYFDTQTYTKAKGFVVIFSCNHCPFAKLYPPRFNDLVKKYTPLGIPVVVVSSTDTIQFEEDTFPEMQKLAQKGKYKFPYLFDGEQEVARMFGASKTPQAFVIWRKQSINIKGKKSSTKPTSIYEVKYQGAIDDNGEEPTLVTARYVEMALDSLLAGKQPAISQTLSVGCSIAYRPK